MTHLYHDLGIQSNVLVYAEYTKCGERLTKPRVLEALAKVINDQPALSIIGVIQPSETKEENHRLWEARLPALRVQDCVEFVSVEGDVDLAHIFENAHNQVAIGENPFPILACLIIFSQDICPFPETTPFKYLLTPPLPQVV